MLAAQNGHKDIVSILTQKGANLDLVNEVSVHVHICYMRKAVKVKIKCNSISLNTTISYFANIILIII